MINAQQSEKKILFMFILILFNSVEIFYNNWQISAMNRRTLICLFFRNYIKSRNENTLLMNILSLGRYGLSEIMRITNRLTPKNAELRMWQLSSKL